MGGYDCNYCHFEHDKRRRTKKLELFHNRFFHKPSYMGASSQQLQQPVSPSMPLQAPPGLVPLCAQAVPQQRASNVPPPMPCATPLGHASWSSEMVANWLTTNGLGHLVSVF